MQHATSHILPAAKARSAAFLTAGRTLVLVLMLQFSAPALLHCGAALWAFCGIESAEMNASQTCCPDSFSPEPDALPLMAPQLAETSTGSSCGTAGCSCFHATATAADAQLPEGLPASIFSVKQLQAELHLTSGLSLNTPSPAFLIRSQPEKLSSKDLRAAGYGAAPEPLRIIYCSYLI